MSRANILTQQIASLNNILTDLNNELTSLQALSPGTPSLVEIVNNKITSLQSNINSVTNHKSELQTALNKLNSGFSSGEQAIVDSINADYPDEYSTQLENLLCDCSSDERTAFFTDYAAAGSDANVKLLVLQHHLKH